MLRQRRPAIPIPRDADFLCGSSRTWTSAALLVPQKSTPGVTDEHVYTVRHVGDPHHGTGIDRGDNMTEHGGFIVHFFDQTLVDRVAEGFSTPEVVAFEEGGLPRRLWRVTQRKTDTDPSVNPAPQPRQEGTTR